MLAVDCIGHRKGVGVEILKEGVETTCVHLRLKDHLAPSDILGVDVQKSDMLAVVRRVDKVKFTAVEDEVATRLAVCEEDGRFPLLCDKVIGSEEAVVFARLIILADEVKDLVTDDIGGILPLGLVDKIGRTDIFPSEKVNALDDAGKVTAIRTRIIIGHAIFHSRRDILS